MSAAPIPKNRAISADEEIELLQSRGSALRPRSQRGLARRAFLAGRRGVIGSGGRSPSAPLVPAEPLTILFASESGNSEKARFRRRQAGAQETA